VNEEHDFSLFYLDQTAVAFCINPPKKKFNHKQVNVFC